MTRKSFRQADVERIIKAAAKTSSVVQVDLRSMTCTIFPPSSDQPRPVVPQVEMVNQIDAVLDRAPRGITVRDAPPPPVDPDFDHRERYVMQRLVELGVGQFVHTCTIRTAGPHTQKKLKERGYVEVKSGKNGKFAEDEICLTKRGLADWKALRSHRDKYPCL